MAKSLSSILNQIERLQKEAASIQSEVVDRIKKEIAKYGLTAEQLFGQSARTRVAAGKPVKKQPAQARAPKFADGAGNTWGGMGKRPEWLRQALDAGKALEEFLIDGNGKKTSARAATGKRAAKKVTPAVATKATVKTRAAAKKTRARKPRAQSAAAEGKS